MLNVLRQESVSFAQTRTYLLAAIFAAGNILLPQLCHLMPQGGLVWLPIYFFTLVGAYVYGWRVGLLTAIASPLMNYVLFGMPALAVLPAIMLKSGVLAVTATFMSKKFAKTTLLTVAAAVMAYQVVGTLGEWVLVHDFSLAIQDFRIGLPGILVQIFAGFSLIKALQSIR